MNVVALKQSPRFHARWTKMLGPGPADQCWEWKGRLDAKGYGFIKVNGTTTRVHRVAWALAHSQWPPAGMVVRHTCDNPPCCNPAHLILGTVRDNVQDCVRRGRRASGESLRQSMLTASDVRSIRERAAAGDPQSAIARDYGVTQANVSSIVTRRTWRSVA